jgi:hypothetical protein
MVPRLLFAVCLVAAAIPARADDVPLPELTPKGQYLVMTQDDATSTSKCIGDPKTPLCAVETEMAVQVRGKLDFQRIAMGLEGGPLFDDRKPGSPIIYRVVRREVLSDRRFPWNPKRDLGWRNGGLIMQAGDIRIDIIYVNCYREISLTACEHFWGSPEAYIVRRMGDRWVVITWGDPYDSRPN